MDLVDIISQLFGIPDSTAEAGITIVLVLLAAFLLQLIGSLVKVIVRNSQRDLTQDSLSKDLVDLIHKAFKGFDNLQSAYEQNTKTVKEVSEVLGRFGDVLEQMAGDITQITRDVKEHRTVEEACEKITQNLIKTSETIVVIKDIEDNIVAEFTAKPEGDKLVIRFGNTLS